MVSAFLGNKGFGFTHAFHTEFQNEYCFGIRVLDLCIVSLIRCVLISLFIFFALRIKSFSRRLAQSRFCSNVLLVFTLAYLVVKGMVRLISDGECGQIGMKTAENAWYWALMSWQALACFGEAHVLPVIVKSLGTSENKYLPVHLQEQLLVENPEENLNAKPKVYKASFTDLLKLVTSEKITLLFAIIALFFAAVGQVMLPHFTGEVVDSLVVDSNNRDLFRKKLLYLIASAILCGIFTGIRGGLFTLMGVNINIRIRHMLFDSLIKQEIGFFDITKTGDITSRLSSDTTMVRSQMTNLNVFFAKFCPSCWDFDMYVPIIMETCIGCFYFGPNNCLHQYLLWGIPSENFKKCPRCFGRSKQHS